MRPQTRYATSGGYSIAWQSIGRGPDLVMIPGFVSNVEVAWEIPAAARFLEQLASFCRLIVFDKRGTGLSDRVPVTRLPSLEERIDDVRAVMDAAGSERAVLFGISEGGPMAALFAATYPNRVDGLVLYGSYARRDRATSEPDRLEPFVEKLQREWGKGVIFGERSRGAAAARGMTRALGRLERHSASPAAVAAIVRMAYEIDVTDVLPSVSAPTLVLHRTEDPNILVTGGRDLAAGIPGARLVELSGVDHIPYFDPDALLDEIEAFVTGERSTRNAEQFLGTIVFVDLVDSTRIAVEMGDRLWGDLLQSFYAAARALIERHRGSEVKTTGDGLLVLFDGPARAVRCALDIRNEASELNLEARAGLHTGEVGREDGDVTGLAVHIAARVGAAASPGEVWVSRTVRDLVAGSGLRFGDRGTHALKGVPDDWELYAAE